MTRRATAKKQKASPKKAAKSKAVTAYAVVREFFGETKTYSEPDRVFASRKYNLPYDQIEITDRLPAPAP